MTRRPFKIILTVLLGFFAFSVSAQKFYTEVSLDKSAVFVGEPIEVRIGVYTTTWFTRGVDLGNLKVPGAFTVYFRPVSQSKTISGTKYTGVELIYHVFPYEADPDFSFPSIDIEVESPPEGDYKGRKRLLTTAEKSILVKSIPAEYDRDEWMVANSLSVQESWSGSKTSVKVGDVLERRITRKAGGTVPELIPPVEWDSLPGVSLYPSRSSVDNSKTRADISASRIESIRYLFEKEGTVSIPDRVFTWYNPYQKKLFKRTLPGFSVEVLPNPDLGILLTVKDSLENIQETTMVDKADAKPFTIFGMPWKKALFFGVVTLAALYGLFLISGRLWKTYKVKRKDYLRSELFFFREFLKALNASNPAKINTALYRWIDELGLKEPSIQFFLSNYAKGLSIGVNDLQRSSKKDWQLARNRWLKGSQQTVGNSESSWINP